MKIWKHEFNLEGLNGMNDNTLGRALGIEFTEIGDDYLIATMPVNDNTVQPMRILHGGASVALAETLGSVASNLCIEDLTKQTAVGLEINANHLTPGRYGSKVVGKVTPIRVGKSVHVWNIDIMTEAGKKICVSRLTTAIIER
jgi:1,4-dihydroxy-2-naphthoyl-CoA hydrolase